MSFLVPARPGRTVEWSAVVSDAENSFSLARHDGHFEHSIFGAKSLSFDASVPTGVECVGGLVVVDESPLVAIVSGRTGVDGLLVRVRQAGSELSVVTLYYCGFAQHILAGMAAFASVRSTCLTQPPKVPSKSTSADEATVARTIDRCA